MHVLSILSQIINTDCTELRWLLPYIYYIYNILGTPADGFY